MTHAFLETLTVRLAVRGIATFRYQFPYMERGSRRPDPAPVLEATVRSAVEAAAGFAGGLPLVAGGKSLGGRMTSRAAAVEPLRVSAVWSSRLSSTRSKAGLERADHLDRVTVPLLFLQGSRDRLAELDLLGPVVERLGSRATLHVIQDADHSFHVPARTAAPTPRSSTSSRTGRPGGRRSCERRGIFDRLPAEPFNHFFLRSPMTRISVRALAALVSLVVVAPAAAQQDPAALSLERIFSSDDFRSERFGPARWLEGGQAYTTLEPAASAEGNGGSDIVRYDAGTGERTILVAAGSLVPGSRRSSR
jgi:predicted alpha/beta-hydrolase family hydrolase